jgi:predicted anti-sigma-YlaC factor YlaD
VELVTDYFEETLAPRTLSHVEEHLVMCDWCVTYLEQMRATMWGLRMLQEPAPAQPSDELLAALQVSGGGAG